MFEVGFTEIVLILGLALLVLGPEKLPALAEKVGRWTGRARAMARQLRTQLEQEVTLDEMSKSRPMTSPPPAQPDPPPSQSSASSDAAAPEPAPNTIHATEASPPAGETHAAPNDKPHNAKVGLDLDTMLSGMEPPPQSSAGNPAAKSSTP